LHVLVLQRHKLAIPDIDLQLSGRIGHAERDGSEQANNPAPVSKNQRLEFSNN